MSICGRSHHERFKATKQEFKGVLAAKTSLLKIDEVSDVELYSSYLGKVPLKAKVVGKNVYLESIYRTSKNRLIYIKVLDLVENELSEKYLYSPQQLLHLDAVCINKTENMYKYILTLYCYLRINQLECHDENVEKYKNLIEKSITPELTEQIQQEYPNLLDENSKIPLYSIKKTLQKVTSYNSRVDILFSALEYLEFINHITNGQLDTINDQDILVFISGVPWLDNAYWNGQYMVFGNGDSMFYPLTSIDVIGHELSHGLIQGICDLEYKGHSGALNESYADILGTMLEYYVHEKYGSKIFGKSNWLIGEELSMNDSCLRNMSDPHLCGQPKKMYDEYYVSPHSMVDYGGVHINSGIPNYCFYLVSQQMDRYCSLRIFIDCLFNLYKRSDFFNFSHKLYASCTNKSENFNPFIKESLLIVGLPIQSIFSRYRRGYGNDEGKGGYGKGKKGGKKEYYESSRYLNSYSSHAIAMNRCEESKKNITDEKEDNVNSLNSKSSESINSELENKDNIIKPKVNIRKKSDVSIKNYGNNNYFYE